jgi:nucleotide-binding universal stress UspA family protein
MQENITPRIEHILFPIDFSERSCHALPFVESMARRYSAKITLLSIVQPFYYAGIGDPGAAVVVDLDELLRDLKDRLDGALVQEFEGLQVDRVASLGNPAQEIVKFAHTQDVDLIMMPTHGYGPFRSLLLGSVAAKVLHDAECPVWTAAHTAQPAKKPSRSPAVYRNILCAVDGTPASVPLMQWAGAFSKDAGATLRLVHVVSGMEHPIPDYDPREAIARLEAAAGVDAPFCVTCGGVAEAIRDEVLRHDADLVVIGRGVLHRTLGRLRTHAHAIIRQSPCPVLSI